MKACCALHNWLRKTDSKVYFTPGTVDEENIDTGEIIPGRWRSEVIEMRANLQLLPANRSSKLAREFRDHIKRFVNNEGAVPWQESRIH